MSESQTWDKEEYDRLLDVSATYTHSKCPEEILNVKVQTSQEKEMSALKVELKPLQSNLGYEFLDPNHCSLLFLVLK